MSKSLSINLYLRPCSTAIYGKFYLCCLYHCRLFSGLEIGEIWSINYALHFGCVKIHKHCLYWIVFSTDINRYIIFNSFLLFSLLLLVSKLYESVNSTIFFWHAQKLMQSVYLRPLSIFIYGKFNLNFPALFLAFFHQVCFCSSHSWLVSELYELSFWFQRCPEA